MRILLTGGGTAGHINPALAIANHICEKEPDSQVLFVGTRNGLETNLVPRAGYDIEYIKIHGFARSLTPKNIKNLAEIPIAIHAASRIIKKFRPDVVVGTGGYVSGPVLYAASKKNIPTLVHESNAFPGITTRILSGYVDKVALGVEDARKYLKNDNNVILTGTPLMSSLLEKDRMSARIELGLDDRPFIVAFGGSLGAKNFNKTVAEWMCQVAGKNKYQILMGTGKNNQYNDVLNQFKEYGFDIANQPDIKICEYIYNMDTVMSAADLIISRAGASTLCELTALGKPAILVPSPYVTGNHQEHNARAIEKGGGAVVILEKDFLCEKLNETVYSLTKNKDVLLNMQKNSAKMGHIDALDVLYNEIKSLIK